MFKNGTLMKETETEVTPKVKRRQFSAAYKAKILQEFDACPFGEKGAFLRREGLYSANITDWRREQEQGFNRKTRGPKVNPQAVENKRLQKENESLRKKLKQAELVIEVQKKVSQLLAEIDQENGES
jgi:transposase